MLGFSEHICELTIEFCYFLRIRLSNTTSILFCFFQRGNTLGVFFLTIDVPIKTLGISLNITNQVVNI